MLAIVDGQARGTCAGRKFEVDGGDRQGVEDGEPLDVGGVLDARPVDGAVRCHRGDIGALEIEIQERPVGRNGTMQSLL